MKTVKLGEIAELTVGFVGSMTEQYVDEGVPFLRSLNIKPFEINNDDIRYITEEFNKKIKKSMLHSGDVVIVRTGVPGTCCVVPEEYDGCNCSDVVIVRPNKELVDPLYLAGFVNFWGQKQISNNKVGAIQQHFNVRIAEEMLIMVPDLEVQKKIAKILENLNSKIRANKKINDNLYKQSQDIFNYWFTQFDFPDKDGKPYKTSGGSMFYSDKIKDKIPENWQVKPLTEFIKIIRGVSYSPNDQLTETTENSVLLLKSNNIQNHSINVDSPIILPASVANDDQWLTKGSVFMTMSSGSKAHMGKTAIIYDDMPYVFGAFCAKIDINESMRSFLSTYFVGDSFRSYIENVTLGTSINNISSEHLTDIKLPLPDKTTLERFEKVMSPIFAMQANLFKETSRLEGMRNKLLPLLMNGQATISD